MKKIFSYTLLTLFFLIATAIGSTHYHELESNKHECTLCLHSKSAQIDHASLTPVEFDLAIKLVGQISRRYFYQIKLPKKAFTLPLSHAPPTLLV